MKLWYLSHRRPAKSGEPAHARILTRAFAVRIHDVWKKMKGLTKNQTSSPHWMAAHKGLKNEFTEAEKCHNLMRWIKCGQRKRP